MGQLERLGINENVEDYLGAALENRGLKRICMSCGTRFYDLNKDPIKCPSCGTEFTGEIKVKARRGRAVANDAEDKVEDVAPAAVEETETVERDEGVMSLEDVEEGDDDIDEADELPLEDDLEDLEEIEEEEVVEEEASDKKK